MASHFPQRPEAHQLANESEIFFRSHLPRDWTCESPPSDYGVDLRIGIVSGGQVSGKELLVQLESSAEEKPGDSVSVRLKSSTYRYLRGMLPVALLVKYVASEQEAYWLLLKDIAAPPEGQQTFTVRIPRANRLSQNPWSIIEGHIRRVHDRKLGIRSDTREEAPTPRLNQVPSSPPDFLGRAEQIQELITELQSNNKGAVCSLRGLGGLGKTTLATVVAQRAASAFPDGLLWVELKGSRPGGALSTETAMGRLIHSFDPTCRLSTEVASMQTQYLAALRGKKCLIVLDDARSAEQIKPLLPPEPAALIVTSRVDFQLPGMRSFKLPAMHMQEAVGLMRAILIRRHPLVSEEDLETIATLCQRLPLAVRAAASFLAENEDWEVQSYIAALKTSRLNALRTEDPELNVRAVLGFSHSQLLEHQPQLARHWQLLAIIPSQFDVTAAAAIWNCAEKDAQDSLSTLRRRAMLEYDTMARCYRFHDLMRDLAEEEFRKRGETLSV
jgi:hypothetical protein